MAEIIFIIGHPASGKTSLANRILERLQLLRMTAFRLDDREFFWQVFELDQEQELHRVYPDGSHAITDPRFFDLQTRLMAERLLETEWFEDFIFVELTSRDYPRLISQLDPGFLADCGLILLIVSESRAVARNAQRQGARLGARQGARQGLHPGKAESTENSRVPEHYIQSCFRQPFDLQMLPAFFSTALVLENDRDDLALLDHLAEEGVGFLLKFRRGEGGVE